MVASPEMRPNIVLVVMDTARADAFEPYGAATGSTPTVAQMAASGSVSTATYSTANWTVPGHVSMLSGLLPRSAGVAQVPGGEPAACKQVIRSLESRWLPEVLRRAGYATGGVSANLWIADYAGFDTGFDRFRSIRTTRHQHLHDTRLRGRLRWALEGARARADDGVAQAHEVLRQWVEEGPTQPFFWFVNLVECHSPYLPAKPYNDLFVLDRIRAADEAQRYLNMATIWRTCLGGEPLPVATLERMRHLYRRSVLTMDDWLGRFLELLDAHGLIEDTVVVVTSDHGENLGEGGLIGHAFSLDNRLLEVPLVSSRPELPATGITSLADLPAALAELAGITDHPWQARTVPAGVAVAQMDGLAASDDPRAAGAVRDWGLGAEALRLMSTTATAAVRGPLKLVRAGGTETLFRLDSDPLEGRPLAVDGTVEAELGADLATLRAALDASDREAEEVLVGVSAPDPGAHTMPGREEIESQMRLLGYL